MSYRHIAGLIAGVLVFALSATGADASAAAKPAADTPPVEKTVVGPRAEMQRKYDELIAKLQSGAADKEAKDKLRDAYQQRATMYETAGELDKAETDFTAATKVAPVDASTYSERGYFYIRSRRYGDALSDFVAGSRLEPDNAAFRYGAGRVMANMKNFNAAIEMYNDAIKLDPKDGRRYLSRAEALVWLGRFNEARPDYDRALATVLTREDKFFALLGRGYALLDSGEYADAVRDLDVALEMEPTHANALTWRGFAYERLGSTDAALRDYESAVQRAPGNTWLRASVQRMRSVERQVSAMPPEPNRRSR
jgi:tetratricopeptide (TPR) repeat protein